jgi:hypothetical protein
MAFSETKKAYLFYKLAIVMRAFNFLFKEAILIVRANGAGSVYEKNGLGNLSAADCCSQFLCVQGRAVNAI